MNFEDSELLDAVLNPHPMTETLEQDLEKQVMGAVAHSRYLKLNIAQIARAYGVPPEVVGDIAEQLTQKYFGHDLESLEFQKVVKQIARIEETISDPGLRDWKIQALAKKCKRSYRDLMQCYNKALVNQNPVEPMSLREFRQNSSTEVEWLIPGWLPLGTCALLHGDGGTGKTLMAYGLARAIAYGEPWNGYETRQGKVLLIQCDEPQIVLRNRMDLFQIGDDAPLGILPDWQVEAIPRLATYLETERPSLVVIDSLSAINTSTIFSENDTEYARPILQLTKLCSQFNTTMVLIHHSNAAGQARGTRAIHNSASEVWGLKVADNQKDRILTVNKTRLGRAPGSYRFEFDEDDYSFTYVGDLDDAEGNGATQEEKIRIWLYEEENRGIPYTSREIREKCAIPAPATRRALLELWSKGVVQRRPSRTDKRGFVYFSPPAEQSELINLARYKTDPPIKSPAYDPTWDTGECVPGGDRD
jgi:archaellum biogenesis ATPase FlaH